MPEETIRCTAPVCLEESRDIPEIGSTGMRKGKQTVTTDGRALGWTHLNCEAPTGQDDA